jgi:transposase
MSTLPKKRFRLEKTSFQDIDDVLQFGVGMDVHKHQITVCISGKLSSGDIVTVKNHVFRASPRGLDELVRFLQKFSPVNTYLMECTGVYHLPVYYALQKAFPEENSKIIAMNPLMLNRRVGDLGQHADRTDAKGLAFMAHYNRLLRPSYVGGIGYYRQRQMLRHYHRVKTQTTRIRNRLTQVFDAENFKFPLDLKTDWGLQLLDHFVQKSWTFGEAFSDLISTLKLQNKAQGVLLKRQNKVEEYAHIVFHENSRFIIQMHLANLLYEEAQAASFLVKVESLALKNQELAEGYQKLLQIPGFGPVSALTVLLELGDYNRFANWKSLAKYCGVVPTIHKSGTIDIKGHINRHTNSYLRKAFTQVAGILINRVHRDTDLARYAHLQFRINRMPYKKALIKIGNKVTKTVYNVLVLKIPYDANHEYSLKRIGQLNRKLTKQGTLLDSRQTRALRRDVGNFLVTNFEFLNSSSKYHLKAGFTRVIRKAKWLESNKDERKGGKKVKGKK